MLRLGIPPWARTLALTTAAAALTVLAALALTTAGASAHRPTGLGGLLEYAAWWALLGTGAWSTTVFGLVVRAHATGRLGRLPCPRSWRPLIAAICGLGAAGLIALPSTATATAVPALPGLGRPSGGTTHPAHAGHDRGHVVVAPGDSLWRIVVRRHPGEPAETTARRVRHLHRVNRAIIGPDPDLIRPGQRLVADDRDPGARR